MSYLSLLHFCHFNFISPSSSSHFSTQSQIFLLQFCLLFPSFSLLSHLHPYFSSQTYFILSVLPTSASIFLIFTFTEFLLLLCMYNSFTLVSSRNHTFASVILFQPLLSSFITSFLSCKKPVYFLFFLTFLSCFYFCLVLFLAHSSLWSYFIFFMFFQVFLLVPQFLLS